MEVRRCRSWLQGDSLVLPVFKALTGNMEALSYIAHGVSVRAPCLSYNNSTNDSQHSCEPWLKRCRCFDAPLTRGIVKRVSRRLRD